MINHWWRSPWFSWNISITHSISTLNINKTIDIYFLFTPVHFRRARCANAASALTDRLAWNTLANRQCDTALRCVELDDKNTSLMSFFSHISTTSILSGSTNCRQWLLLVLVQLSLTIQLLWFGNNSQKRRNRTIQILYNYHYINVRRGMSNWFSACLLDINLFSIISTATSNISFE